MKKEWKKHEKALYLPKSSPEIIEVPEMKYYILSGEGDPNSDFFAECVAALYALSYAVRMSYKGEEVPEGYYEYVVYPLEGVWDFINPNLKVFDKKNLKFDLMIRQPEFLTEALAERFKDMTLKKKQIELVSKVKFKVYPKERCVQMLHLGSYDDEPKSFEKMQAFCEKNGLERLSQVHREIYITDARKTEPQKLKTVLRYTLKR